MSMLATSCFVDDVMFSHNNAIGADILKDFARWQHRDRNCCLRLPCVVCACHPLVTIVAFDAPISFCLLTGFIYSVSCKNTISVHVRHLAIT